MINVLMAFCFWELYLFSDAYQDVDHAKKYGKFSHKTNFWQRLVVGVSLTSFTYQYFQNLLVTFLFGCWLVVLGWVTFELMSNKLAKQNWDHVGTGGIDLWFREMFPGNYKRVMVLTKAIFLIISTWAFFSTLL